MDSEVLTLLLTAHYVGAPAFNALGKDIDALASKSGGLAKTGAAISAIGVGVTAVTVAMAAGVVEAMKQASKYQDAIQRMTSVHAIAADQVGALNQAIMETSQRFGQNSTDIASSLYFITSSMEGLGYSIANNKQVAKEFFGYIIPAMGAMVAASGHGLPGSITWQQAAQDVTHIAGGLGLDPKYWPQLMGSMTMVERMGGLTQKQLTQASLRALPSAREVGVNYQDLFAAIGAASTAGAAGTGGARAGTELGAAWRTLLTNSTAQKALASLGLKSNQFFDKKGNLLNTDVILGMIDSRLLKIKDPTKRFALQQKLFGATGNRTMGLLAQPSVLAVYERLLKAEAQNPVAQMFGVADAQLADFTGSIKKLTTAFQNFLKIIGGPLMTGLQPMIDGLTNSLSKLNGFLLTGTGQQMLTHLPGLAVGAIGAGAVLGPGMQYGGGLLRDWASAQNKRHDTYLSALADWQGRTDLQKGQLASSLDIRRGDMLQRQDDLKNQLSTRIHDRLSYYTRQRGALAKKLYDQWSVRKQNYQLHRGDVENQLTTATSDRLTKYDTAITKARALATQQRQARKQKYLTDLRAWVEAKKNYEASAPVRRSARDIAGTREFDKYMAGYAKAGSPGSPVSYVQSLLDQEYADAVSKWKPFAKAKPIRPSGAVAAEKTAQRLVDARADYAAAAGKSTATTLANLDARYAASERLAQDAGDRAFKDLRRQRGTFVTSARNHLKALLTNQARQRNTFEEKAANEQKAQEDRAELAKPDEVLTPGKLVKAYLGRIGGGIWSFGKKFGPLNLAKQGGIGALKGLQSIPSALGFLVHLPRNALGGLVNLFKGIGPALAGAIPVILGFGSALVPIIAVALLVVGAVTALVLIFTRYRKEAMQVGRAILQGLAPIFKFLAGVVKSTLSMIGKAWNDHKKQIDAAMKGLLTAFKAALPFFQVVGGIIAGVITLVVRVVGYLVSAFLDALPGILNFFGSVLHVLGDLGRIVLDVIHGKWGQAWKDAQALLQHAWEGIQQLLGAIWTFIKGVFSRLWADIGPTLGKLWNGFVAALPGIWQKIQDLFSKIPSLIQQLQKNVEKWAASTWASLGKTLGPALAGLWNTHIGPFLASLPGKALGALGNLGGDILTALFSGKGGKGGKGSSSILGAALPGLLNLFKALGPKILPALGGFMGIFLNIWKTLFTKLPPLLDRFWKSKVVPFFHSLPGKITKALDGLKAQWDLFWKVTWPKVVQPALVQLWEHHIKPFLKSLPGKVGTLLGLLWNTLQTFWKSLGPKIAPFLLMLWTKYIWPFLQSLPGKMFHVLLFILPKFNDIFHMAGKVLDTVFMWLWTNVFWPFLKSLPGKILGAIQSLGTLLFNFFKGLGQKAVDGMNQGLSNMASTIRNATANIPVVGGVARFMTRGYASGGDILHGQYALVGEHGPEMVRLPGGSHVYPHDQTTAMLRPLTGGSRMLQLRVASLHVDNLHGLEHLQRQQDHTPPGKTARTPAEEFLFARQIQAQREGVWDRYQNTSREFDNTYRRAYQYYG